MIVACAVLASCAPSRLDVEVPPFEGTRVLVVGPRDRAPSEVWIASSGSASSALPAVEISDGDVVVLTALEIDGPPPVAPGRYAVASAGQPQLELPQARRARGTELTVHDSQPLWRELAAVPEPFVALSVAVECPPPGPVVEPVVVPKGCPFRGPDRGAICYGTPRRATTIEADPLGRTGGNNPVSSFSIEAGRIWAYLHTDRTATPGADVFDRPARVRMRTATVADPSTFELLPVVPPVEAAVRGWSAFPKVRRDGLELFFSSSIPDAHFWDEEIHHAWRRSIDEPWSLERAGVLSSVSNPDNGQDPERKTDADQHEQLLLLPDHRTLLFVEGSTPLVQVARRKTTNASDTDFVRSTPVALEAFEAAEQIKHFTMSCDGRHVLYTRTYLNRSRSPGGPEHIREGRIAEILGFEPLAFGPPRTLVFVGADRESPYGLPLRRVVGAQDVAIAESPDCQAFFVTPDFEPWVAERVPCP